MASDIDDVDPGLPLEADGRGFLLPQPAHGVPELCPWGDVSSFLMVMIRN